MATRLSIALLIASACVVLPAAAGQTPVYKLLYSPPQGANVGLPSAILEGRPGLFYVMGSLNSNTFGATVFSLTSTGTFTSIYALPPYTSSNTLAQGTNGLLYGPASYLGGPGTPTNYYYSVSTSGKNFKQYPLPGTYPNQWGSLLNETMTVPPAQLYDIVYMMVGNSRVYAFAELQQSGKFSILHQFTGSEGVATGGNLAYAADGNIYSIGNQQSGGFQPGFIFRFTLGGAYSQLVSFPQPFAPIAQPLVAASDGNLYAALSSGGANNTGQIFQATLSGQLKTVANFPAKGVHGPAIMMQAADGNLYGTTTSNAVFRYDLATGQLSRVYQFNPAAAGQPNCPCPLIEGMDGKLYGVSAVGGNFPGDGAVFSLDIGLPKPLPVVTGMFPASGPVGQKVILWGNYLLGLKSVSFNGTIATGPVPTSAQSVLVTVPTGATTGPVTINTINGSFTTTQSFTVQ